MKYVPSLYDQLGTALSPTMRKLNDLKLQFIGRKTNVLRISKTPKDINGDGYEDLLGDTINTFQSKVIKNLYIEYPFNEVEMSQMLDSTVGPSDITATAITELMPIKMIVPFYGETVDSSRDFDQDDIIVDVLVDQFNHKIPVILTGPKLIGTIWNRQLVKKTFMLTFYRGKLETDIQSEIDSYVNSIDTIIGDDQFYNGEDIIKELDQVNYTNRLTISSSNFDIIDAVSLNIVNISRWSLFLKCGTKSVFKKYVVVQNGTTCSLLEIQSVGDTINFTINSLIDSENVYLQIKNNELSDLQINFLRDCFQSNFSSYNLNFQTLKTITGGQTLLVDSFSTDLIKTGKWCLNVYTSTQSYIEDILFIDKNGDITSSTINQLGDSIPFSFQIAINSTTLSLSVINTGSSDIVVNCNRLVSYDLNNSDAEIVVNGSTITLDTIPLSDSHICKWELYSITTTKSNYQQLIALENNLIISDLICEQVGDTITLVPNIITDGNNILLQLTNNSGEDVSIRFTKTLI